MMWNFFAAFAKNQMKNQILCGQGILGQEQVILQYKAASVVLKRGKTHLNQFFQSTGRRLPPPSNYVPRGETVTAAYIHKALAEI